MDPDENLIQYVKSLGEEFCIKKEFDIWNGLAVNREKLIRRTDGQTDGRTDRASYRSASHLKINQDDPNVGGGSV